MDNISRPSELKDITSPDANLVYLIDIAKVANKYSFKSMETWSLDVIQEFVNRKPSPILSAIPPPHLLNPLLSSLGQPITSHEPVDTTDQLTRLIRLAQLCHHERLLSTMIGLLRQLMSSSIQYAYLAMTLSDELDLRALRGAAYLEVMQKAEVVKKVNPDLLNIKQPTPTTNTNTIPQNSEERLFITRAQQHRLLAGYYRLTSTWDKIRSTPLPFEHSHSCSATWHQQGCTQSWLEFWKEKTRSDTVMNLGQADVLGRLKLVQKDYDRWGSATYMHHDCRISAKKAIGDLIKKVEEALPDYFTEPGDSDDDWDFSLVTHSKLFLFFFFFTSAIIFCMMPNIVSCNQTDILLLTRHGYLSKWKLSHHLDADIMVEEGTYCTRKEEA